MTKGRAPTAAKAWRQLLCDPRGNLTEAGRLVMADLAKYCRAHDPPTRMDAAGKVDALATMEVVGQHKLLGRIRSLLALDENVATRLALMPWPQDTDEEPQ